MKGHGARQSVAFYSERVQSANLLARRKMEPGGGKRSSRAAHVAIQNPEFLRLQSNLSVR